MMPAAPQDVPGECRRAIVEAFPDLARSTFSVAGIGWNSLAVDIDGRLIAKFPEGREAEIALRREAPLLGAAGPFLTMAVPKMTIHEGPPLFSIHEKLRGPTLERADYGRLDEVAREQLAGDLALFFAELHAIDPSTMRAAGAEPIGIWDTEEATLRTVWRHLPEAMRGRAEAALRDYRDLRPDPLGDVYGFFDAHGWNMAFDHKQGRLNGIFDFASA